MSKVATTAVVEREELVHKPLFLEGADEALLLFGW
jgi:hypothetical protein